MLAGSTVRLAWQAVPDADLAGYLVYRSTTAGRGHVRLSAAPQAGTTYVDTDVRPGQTYYYVVTAVDRSKRANESVPSPEASAAASLRRRRLDSRRGPCYGPRDCSGRAIDVV